MSPSAGCAGRALHRQECQGLALHVYTHTRVPCSLLQALLIDGSRRARPQGCLLPRTVYGSGAGSVTAVFALGWGFASS